MSILYKVNNFLLWLLHFLIVREHRIILYYIKQSYRFISQMSLESGLLRLEVEICVYKVVRDRRESIATWTELTIAVVSLETGNGTVKTSLEMALDLFYQILLNLNHIKLTLKRGL